MDTQYDIAVIGGGVIGSAVARELSRYQLKICVLEKELDVCNGVSGRNTGLLHSGILNEKNLLRTECCMEGNAEFERVAGELDVPFRRCGKLIVGFGEEERKRLEGLYQRGLDNGVPGIRMIGRDEIKRLDSNVDGEFAIYVPSAGILCPFTYTIALAENAVENGAAYYLDHEVTGIEREETGVYRILTKGGEFVSRWVINCAGLYACRISEMLGFESYIPNRVKGEYEILDKKAGNYLSLPVYPTPNEYGAFDVHVTPTIDGNVLVGPTIETIGAKVDYAATQKMTDVLVEQGSRMFPRMKRDYYIRNYVGVFPTIEDPATHRELDFQIQTKKSVPHAVNLLAITSPGLTSALPIARRVAAKIKEQEELLVNEKFNPIRRGIVKFSEQDEEGKKRLIEQDPDYGEIYCRCECVTRAEVKQALHNVLGVSTVSGIKYRTRATMGRCQGGYCETRLTRLIQEELGRQRTEILLNKKGAYMFTGEVK
ncbi:MAG: NAD(P)/FAD-dependent oxidoreductase [Muricomes sp.]|uniref:NAD(P)/FAD-dependent oxidoreductase n=1 Tax=Faecalicatena contorta TaxID=39482 RepID=UPI002EAC9467|nr:NAD(P)/FAD-dependent oxidoreductase [Muricomes sp.]